MRKLTSQEQQWVEIAYPLVKEMMKRYNLSENDTIDWHGELSVTLCEATIEFDLNNSIRPSFLTTQMRYQVFVSQKLEDRIHSIIESEQYQIKEIPSGLRPRKVAGRGFGL